MVDAIVINLVNLSHTIYVKYLLIAPIEADMVYRTSFYRRKSDKITKLSFLDKM